MNTEYYNEIKKLKWYAKEDVPCNRVDIAKKLPSGWWHMLWVVRENFLDNLDSYCYYFSEQDYISRAMEKLESGQDTSRTLKEILTDADYLASEIKALRQDVQRMINKEKENN